jgi:hypothetical protein
MVYQAKFFKIQEFMPPAFVKEMGEERCWWFIRPEIVAVADTLRQRLGRKVLINTWAAGGTTQFRGFRPLWCKIGGDYSQHRMGCAIDVEVPGMPPAEVLAYLRKNAVGHGYIDLGLSTVEDTDFTPTWLHLDIRPRTVRHPINDFLIVQPN